MTMTMTITMQGSTIPLTDLSPYTACVLCPRACRIDRTAGARGACGASAEVRVARAALHFWEEPPISGQAGSGTIFFVHCPLGCAYCQNRTISHSEVGERVSAGQLAEMMVDLQEQGALNINCVTPTHYAPTVREAVMLAREQGLVLPIVWNTSGYETVDAVRANDDIVDVYLTDFKYADADLGRRYSRVGDYPERALEALDAMVEVVGEPVCDVYRSEERMARGVIVRHLLLPGHLEDSKRVVDLLQRRYGNSIRLSLMNQYTPVLASAAEAGDAEAARILERFPNLRCTVAEDEYEELLDYADALGVVEYFWQQGGTQTESFIPAFNDGSGSAGPPASR